MTNAIFLIVAFGLIGLIITIFLGLLRNLGVDFIVNTALQMILYDQKAYFRSHVLWNKLWLRFGVLAFAIAASGTFASLLLKPLIPSAFSSSAWFYLSVIITFAYGYWIRIGKPSPFVLSNSDQDSKEPEGFSFSTQEGNINLYNIFRGIFICGGPGSGKSKSVIEPIIQQSAAANLTGILYDRKFPTLAVEVAGAYQTSSVSIYYVNFTDLTRSHRINPVGPNLLTNASYAREAAVTTIGNLDYKASQKRDIWIQTAEALLTGSIWYLRNNYPEYCTLPHASSLIIEAHPKALLELLNKDEEVRGLIAAITSSQDSEKTLASIFTTVQSYLGVLNTPEIFWVMSGDDVPFDLNDPLKPSFLVVGNDADLPATYSPLISLIIATATKRMNKPNKLPSIVILDEAPTLFIPNFQELPATARANQVATVYAVQDISQMEGQLGPQQSEMLLGNLSNQFYGRSTNPKTLQRITTLFGKHDVEYQSTSAGRSSGDRSSSSSQNISTSVQQRDRLPMQSIRDLRTGQFAGFIAEGNVSEFVSQFDAPHSKAVTIQPFVSVSEADKRNNFRQIKEDVRRILKESIESSDGPLPPTRGSRKEAQGNSDSWEDFA
ncbi:type IV secretion system DNA-binding domain-containing protein (plasmid) [Spirosoma rhododendri]|uniref:Type IV secretion system DNA-binding domain-containing protein n=1 Tax=Spirosoma rhododendri TaxID=2728024 RepID=A0A7L5DT89_9BACT|nr:type IV secretion system DNA-binding domain-containing protein [Spirosoma rhododendri]